MPFSPPRSIGTYAAHYWECFADRSISARLSAVGSIIGFLSFRSKFIGYSLLAQIWVLPGLISIVQLPIFRVKIASHTETRPLVGYCYSWLLTETVWGMIVNGWSQICFLAAFGRITLQYSWPIPWTLPRLRALSTIRLCSLLSWPTPSSRAAALCPPLVVFLLIQ
jgi:hypothetical protein